MNSTVEKFIPFADMIAETFGPDCEVVLHDLNNPEHSVAYVANNSVTGREVGESFNLLVKEVMMSPKLKESYVANYFFVAKNGKQIRSSTMLLRDEKGTVRGAICINIDITRDMETYIFLQNFLPKQEIKPIYGLTQENEQGNVQQMVADLIDQILHDADSAALSRDEKIEKIKFMDAQGIFLMKGAIDLVAEKMGVTKVTVYSYLDEARGKR